MNLTCFTIVLASFAVLWSQSRHSLWTLNCYGRRRDPKIFKLECVKFDRDNTHYLSALMREINASKAAATLDFEHAKSFRMLQRS